MNDNNKFVFPIVHVNGDMTVQLKADELGNLKSTFKVSAMVVESVEDLIMDRIEEIVKEQGCSELYVLGKKEVTAMLGKYQPKKLRHSLSERGCPACFAHINFDVLNDRMENAPKYCSNCGQALDWTEENNDNS